MKTLVTLKQNKSMLDYIIDKCTEAEIERKQVLCIDLSTEEWFLFVAEVQSVVGGSMDISLFEFDFRFNGVIVRPDREAVEFITHKGV